VNWELLLCGLVVALSPLPVVCFILLLGAPRSIAKGVAYIVGWIVSLTVIVVGTLILTGGHPPRPDTAPRAAVSWITGLLGVGLVAFGLWQRRREAAGPRPPKPPPTWMAKVDTMPIWVAAGLGVLLQPWPFVAAGAASVAGMDLSAWAVVSLVLFGVLATSSLLTMEVYVILAPEGGQIRLTRLRTWLEVNRSQVLTVLALVLGAALVVKAGIQLLS
jgi:hypothetical protein